MKLVSKGGEVLVDKKKCPALHRVLTRMAARLQESRKDWGRVIEARKAGEEDKADRIARRLMGIQGPEMSEEKKAELKAYYEAHKDEIAAKRKAKAAAKRRMKELTKARRRK